MPARPHQGLRRLRRFGRYPKRPHRETQGRIQTVRSSKSLESLKSLSRLARLTDSLRFISPQGAPPPLAQENHQTRDGPRTHRGGAPLVPEALRARRRYRRAAGGLEDHPGVYRAVVRRRDRRCTGRRPLRRGPGRYLLVAGGRAGAAAAQECYRRARGYRRVHAHGLWQELACNQKQKGGVGRGSTPVTETRRSFGSGSETPERMKDARERLEPKTSRSYAGWPP